MPSRARRAQRPLLLVLLAGCLAAPGLSAAETAGAAAGAAAPPAAAPSTAVPTSAPAAGLRQRVADAVGQLRKDPNLGAERSVRTLRWVEREREPAEPSPFFTRLVEWLAEAFRWFAAAGRAVLVTAAVLLAALLAVYLLRAAARRRAGRLPAATAAPAFVRGLDIRPESLPEDIGTAALALWRQGAARAALALLYRGLLSRAVHVHQVPIRDSSTEGDCLRLCAGRLGAAAQDYAATLVGTWQQAVYRGVLPDESRFGALCAGFTAALAPATPSAPSTPLAAGANA